jgi:ubiquinone/menaquinone biosynthesis C-methylase UbiE
MSTANRFDEIASQWDSNPMRRQLAIRIAEAITARLQLDPGARALDLGAGTGLVSLMLAPRLREVVATDSSAGMLAEIEKKLAGGGIANVRALRWDADEGDCPESGFDLVFSSMAMHHVRDTAALLARIARALRPGGTVALADLDTEDGLFHGDVTGVHHKGFDREALRGLLEAAGFEQIEIRDATTMTRPDGRTYGIFLATARLAAR